MVRITEQLVRKRAEHNEGEISSLEELSLHQQDIEKIEHLDKWCRELKILYLQSNLIPKIENVSRLKKLQYLNLALNNIEKVENLQGCESLEKLDLTVNFIGDIMSLQSLRHNLHLREIYLTGNPCCQFSAYRHFVIANLPQLKTLDGEEITKSERIQAEQNMRFILDETLREQEAWMRQRDAERQQAAERLKKIQIAKQNGQELDEEFFQEKVAYTPESRIETHEFMEQKRRKENPEPEKVEKPERQLFFPDGRPYNINEAKIDFSLIDEEEENQFVLDVAVFKHMGTELIDCDVQPNYVRVTIKGKLLQLSLPAEVRPDASSAQRSAITGHLVLKMPKLQALIAPKQQKQQQQQREQQHQPQQQQQQQHQQQKREYLEVDASSKKGLSLTDIYTNHSTPAKATADQPPAAAAAAAGSKVKKPLVERPNSPGFVDNPDVPPLE